MAVSIEKGCRLIDLLLSQTREGHIKWEITTLTDTFITSIEGKDQSFTVRLRQAIEQSGRGHISLTVTDKREIVIYHVRSHRDLPDDYRHKLGELFELARQQAPEQPLDDLLRLLSKPQPMENR